MCACGLANYNALETCIDYFNSVDPENMFTWQTSETPFALKYRLIWSSINWWRGSLIWYTLIIYADVIESNFASPDILLKDGAYLQQILTGMFFL